MTLHDITKHIRRSEKMELSGAVYAAVEREAQAVWARHAKRVLAGAPLPEFRDGKALSIRGHRISQAESGVRIVFRHNQFVAELSVQSKDCDGGCWITIPIAKNTGTDEYQSPILHKMAAWDIPIRKATIELHRERGRAIIRLTYGLSVEIPRAGQRRATLGPIHDHRFQLRTDTGTFDQSARLNALVRRKGLWDQKRREVMRSIGRGPGHARKKRKVLQRINWADWLTTHLHQWTREIITRCQQEGVGELTIAPLSGADWPAFRFTQLLKQKGDEVGIIVNEETDIADRSTKRALKREAQRQRRRSTKMNDAIREIESQLERIEA